MNRSQGLFLAAGFAFGVLVGWALFQAAEDAPSRQAAMSMDRPAGPRATNSQGSAGGAPAVAELAELRKQLEAEPENLQALVRSGDLYSAIQSWDQALEFYGRAIQTHPDRFDLAMYIGDHLLSGKRPDLAIGFFEKALKLDPESAQVYKQLGICYGEMQQPREALGMFSTAIEKDPSDWETLYNAVVVAGLHLGEKDSAEALLKQLEERRPGDANVIELRRQFDEAMTGAGS
jgi:tetratricopeptide (TPR) repeat protein